MFVLDDSVMKPEESGEDDLDILRGGTVNISVEGARKKKKHRE